jgi:hypothetical protein
MIVKVQDGSDEVHSQVYLDGYVWEFTPNGGAKKTAEADFNFKTKYSYLNPIKEMTSEEVFAMGCWWKDQLGEDRPYNYLKLFTCLALADTKSFWNKLGHTPFSNEIFGDFCSAGVDDGFKFIGWDLLPNQIEELTSCADLNKSAFHKLEV